MLSLTFIKSHGNLGANVGDVILTKDGKPFPFMNSANILTINETYATLDGVPYAFKKWCLKYFVLNYEYETKGSMDAWELRKLKKDCEAVLSGTCLPRAILRKVNHEILTKLISLCDDLLRDVVETGDSRVPEKLPYNININVDTI